MLKILPVIAYALTVIAIVMAVRQRATGSGSWIAPALAGIAFGAFTLVTIAREGVMQFWYNHVANLAGNQVWFDLLAAVSVAFFLIVPRARAVGMAVVPWAVAVVLSASVALLPMLARLLWLEARDRRAG